MAEIKNKIRAYIVDNFLFGDDQGLEDGTSFLDSESWIQPAFWS